MTQMDARRRRSGAGDYSPGARRTRAGKGGGGRPRRNMPAAASTGSRPAWRRQTDQPRPSAAAARPRQAKAPGVTVANASMAARPHAAEQGQITANAVRADRIAVQGKQCQVETRGNDRVRLDRVGAVHADNTGVGREHVRTVSVDDDIRGNGKGASPSSTATTSSVSVTSTAAWFGSATSIATTCSCGALGLASTAARRVWPRRAMAACLRARRRSSSARPLVGGRVATERSVRCRLPSQPLSGQRRLLLSLWRRLSVPGRSRRQSDRVDDAAVRAALLGQPLQPSYVNNYYQPSYFNAFYPNSAYDCYRYGYGYVYETDCMTGLIEDVIPTYDNGYGVGQILPSSYSYYNVPYAVSQLLSRQWRLLLPLRAGRDLPGRSRHQR